MFLHRYCNRFAVLCAICALFISQFILANSTSSSPVVGGAHASASPMPTKTLVLDVFKSPTCMCCEKWITHLQSHGFQTAVHHPADLNQEKISRGIAPKYQSCHTAISKDGYVFEGHIPASVIQRFLAEKPKGAIGLAVPGMPMGSPGMEMGNHFDPYDVLLLMADGSSSVYAPIDVLISSRIDQQH